MRRRQTTPANDELFPELVAVLLEGWGAPRSDDDPDPFRIFELTDDDLRDRWRRHRRLLLTIARRRRIQRPVWAEQVFDGAAPR